MGLLLAPKTVIIMKTAQCFDKIFNLHENEKLILRKHNLYQKLLQKFRDKLTSKTIILHHEKQQNTKIQTATR